MSQEDRLYDEIGYYQMISQFPQKELFAEFRGNKSNGLLYALELKYYKDFKNLAECFFEPHDSDELKNIIELLLQQLKVLHKYPGTLLPSGMNVGPGKLSQEMLIDKTWREYDNLCRKTTDKNIKALTGEDYIVVNGHEYKNFHLLWPLVKEAIYENSKFDITFIHGDCCFANILVDNECENMIFVDPRGSYGMKGCYGDPAYDYAKILHSLSGNYEQIIYDMFELKANLSSVNYSFKLNYTGLESYVKDSIGDKMYKKAKLIEGLIFIGMCARHYDSTDRQIIMYSTGIKILNEWLGHV